MASIPRLLRPVSRSTRLCRSLPDRCCARPLYTIRSLSTVTPAEPDERGDGDSRAWKGFKRLSRSKKVVWADEPGEFKETKPLNHPLEITLHGEPCLLSSLLVRDTCNCSTCVDPSSKQKNFATVDIPLDISGSIIGSEDGSYKIKWSNDIPGSPTDHTTVLTTQQANAMAIPTKMSFSKAQLREGWTADQFHSQNSDFAFEDYMTSDQTLYTALLQLRKTGLLFVTGIPHNEHAVVKIVERIGNLKNTLYGLTWDVRSVPQAKNVAYTSGDLGFHMDLMYVHSPPQLQLLHCIRSSAKGGASQFSDMYAAALELWQDDRQAFNVLRKVLVPYHYDQPAQYYHRSRPVINLPPAAHSGDMQELLSAAGTFAWSPPFQAPFLASPSRIGKRPIKPSLGTGHFLEEWHEAARKLNAIIHRPENVVERMMKPGECVIFDNRRTLHARSAFDVDDAGKERWLKGAYIDEEVWRSRLNTLARSHSEV